jgi:predicted RNA-binding protein Jag
MSHGSTRHGAGLETFVRDWLDLASARLDVGMAYELQPMGRALRVTLKAVEGAQFGDRRWVQVASALQTLLETAVSRRGFGSSAIEVQVQEAVTTGESGLLAAVRQAAEAAVQRGRAFALGPMSVADRRQVHHALSDFPGVWTQSEGDGIFRRLWIIPRQLLPGRQPKETPPVAPGPTPEV